jgi:hypothetical protein
VHRKYDFIWKHGTLPYFRKPDGKKIMMEVIDDVPYIRTRKRTTVRRQFTAALAVPTIPARTRRRQVAAPARPSHYSSDDEDDGGPPPLVDSSSEESGSDSSDNENESASSGTSDSVPISGESGDATSEEGSSSDSSIEIEDTFRKIAYRMSVTSPSRASLASPSVPTDSMTLPSSIPEVAAESSSDDEDDDSAASEAEAAEHAVSHRYKLKSCRGCVKGKPKRSRRTRKGPNAPHKLVTEFGLETTLDLFQTHLDEQDWGIQDERYGAVFYDRGCDWEQVMPIASKTTQDMVESIVLFKGPDEIKKLYSDRGPEIIAAAKELNIAHCKSIAYSPERITALLRPG